MDRLELMKNKTFIDDGWFIIKAPIFGIERILPIGLLRDTEAAFLKSQRILYNQELAFITDTKEFVIGDGKSKNKDLKRYKFIEVTKKPQ